MKKSAILGICGARSGHGVLMRFLRVSLGLLPLMCVLPAAAQNLPPRKPGLWDMKWGNPGQRGYEVKHCVDTATDQKLGPFLVTASKVCSEPQLSQAGADLVVEWTCTPYSGKEDKARGIITGSFDSSYRIAMTTRSRDDAAGMVLITPSGPVYRSGPFNDETTSTIEATWLGPCGPDQKHGDLIWPDGRKTRADRQ
jgi:hypothetical protein